MTSEAEISNQLHDVFAAFNETFTGITETQMLRQDFDKWSLKDIIAHVTGWNEVMGESLERVARGDSPVRIGSGVEIFDAWNEKFVAKKRPCSPSEGVNDLLVSFQKFHEALEASPEKKFDQRAIERINFEISHYEEHTKQIGEWRKGQ